MPKMLLSVITIVYKILFIVTVLSAAITALIGYAEHIQSVLIENIQQYIPVTTYDFVYENRYPIIAISFLCISVLVVIKLVVRRRRLRRACMQIDIFQKDYGPKISHLLVNYRKDAVKDDPNLYDSMSEASVDFMEKMAGVISDVFSCYTGKPCHVSIKTFDSETGEISTWMRDPRNSHHPRSETDELLQKYNYHENTAFKQIVDHKKCRFYHNNWLKIFSLVGLYNNKNSNWKRQYSATLVVPITDRSNPETFTPENVWGFLCVDNFGGGFDSGPAAYLLSSFARISYNLFTEIGAFEAS